MGRERRKWEHTLPRFPFHCYTNPFIRDEFHPLLEYLEAHDRAPGIVPITAALEAFDPDHVHAAWQKALDRQLRDPEGAITAARMLLETVCKSILDEAGCAYPDTADLPKLWALAAELLNLAPHQHQEEIFKAILGNCQSVVSYLGAIRNKIGDAHGQGRKPINSMIKFFVLDGLSS